MNTILSLEDVAFSPGRTPVLDELSFAVEQGEILCIVGPSGCGKTTLLRLAAGLLTPGRGHIDRVHDCAMVFQDARLLPWQRVTDNIALGLRASGVPSRQRRERARAMAAELGLAEHQGCYPHELSGGLRQRVALARALVVEAPLILLDEPFNALDVGVRQDAQSLLHDSVRRHGVTAVLVTHDLTEAVRLADRILMMGAPPSRIVHEIHLDAPFNQRDAVYQYREAAALLENGAVANTFQGLTDRETRT